MTAAPRSISSLSEEMRTQLAQLIRLLVSDRDGEVVAAVNAIGRTLHSPGFDFHALADFVMHGGKMPAAVATDPMPWQGLARRRLDHPHLLKRGEKPFLRNIWSRPLSEAQQRWLTDIEQRIARAA